MSDQPKPATGEQEFGEQIFCWKCGRPYHTADRECPNCGGRNLAPDLCAKPTGEWWTEQDVDGFWHIGVGDRSFAELDEATAKAIADAHNAALDAEREKRQEAERSRERLQQAVMNGQRFNDALDQLAAEREKNPALELLRSVHTWFMQQAPRKYNGCGLWIDVDDFLKQHPRQNCILEVDSPTFPPDKDEYLQCGCVNCRSALAKVKEEK